MDVVQQFSNEALGLFLQEMNKRNDQLFDIKKLLMMSVEDGKKNQRVVIQGLDEIKKTTHDINFKIDVVLEKLTVLESDFADLKNENREVEEKLTLMMSKLSKLDSSVKEEELEDYYALSQSLYSNWDDFDPLTKKFIPLAEYLYSMLQKYDKPDYSPVILELCRAIENEFLLKIFKIYTHDVIMRNGDNIYSFLKIDSNSDNLQKKTGQFVKAIKKACKTRKPEYTFGQMNMILSIMKEADTVRMSPLLNDFQSYLEENTERENLLDAGYINKVNDIVNEYRNPSAHPEFMTIEKANECRAVIPERIDYLLDCVNTCL